MLTLLAEIVSVIVAVSLLIWLLKAGIGLLFVGAAMIAVLLAFHAFS